MGIHTDSIRNRINAMHTLGPRAVADLTVEQMNAQERPGILPLAFSFVHFFRLQDQSISGVFLQEPPLWEQDDWSGRTGVTVAGFGRVEPVSEMEHQRITDLDAWRAYQAAVIARTNQAMESMTEENLSDVVMDRLPADAQNVYCALVVGRDGPIRKLEGWECFVYQHGLRHMGEIEHGRALVGLQGMT
jgi:hypothetical protein